MRVRCTKAKREPRTVTARTRTHHEVLQAARQRQRTPAFQEQYAMRAGIEGTISQGVRAFDLRRSRYMGVAKTRLQHVLVAVAMNVVRVGTWLAAPHRTKRCAAPFAVLAPAP
jgi:transposase